MENKLSIITINKNNSRGLDATIKSVINQTYFDKIEYIIVDGKSTDDSFLVLNQYADYFDTCISEEDTGIYQAMNKGTRAAHNQYILYLNSGDILVNNHIIENIYEYLHTYDIVYGDIRYAKNHKQKITPEHINYQFFLSRNTLPHQGSFISRELLLEHPNDESLKIASEHKFFFEAICIYNATYKKIPFIISEFNTNGISKRYLNKKENEKQQYLLECAEKITNPQTKNDIINSIYKHNPLLNDQPFQIDYVVTYVNNTDPVWIEQYTDYCNTHHKSVNINGERFRDYGTLKYLLQGVQYFLPWIRNIYLIVEQESQVPDWLDKRRVRVIYHKDIIPSECLPTYNSGTIEMFLHKIPGISEYFIYGNDDMFPIRPMKKSDFFDNCGNPVLSVRKNNLNDQPRMFDKKMANITKFVLGKMSLDYEPNTYLLWNHVITPMRKSVYENLWTQYPQRLKQSCTPFRTVCCLGQHLFYLWNYCAGHYSNEYTLKAQYLSISTIHNSQFLNTSRAQIICLNDRLSNDPDDTFPKIKQYIIEAFDDYFNHIYDHTRMDEAQDPK